MPAGLGRAGEVGRDVCAGRGAVAGRATGIAGLVVADAGLVTGAVGFAVGVTDLLNADLGEAGCVVV